MVLAGLGERAQGIGQDGMGGRGRGVTRCQVKKGLSESPGPRSRNAF
jgi:hypothetical protein